MFKSIFSWLLYCLFIIQLFTGAASLLCGKSHSTANPKVAKTPDIQLTTSERQVAVMLFSYQEVLVINAKPLSKVSKNQRAVLLELEMTGHVLPENTQKNIY